MKSTEGALTHLRWIRVGSGNGSLIHSHRLNRERSTLKLREWTLSTPSILLRTCSHHAHWGLPNFSLFRQKLGMKMGDVVAALAAQVGPRPDIDRRDVAHDAIAGALGANPALKSKGKLLFEAASERLAGILRQRHWEARKTPSVSLNTAAGELRPLETQKQKQFWKDRLPKGLARHHAFDSGFNVVPTADGDEANETELFAAAQLLTVDLPRLASGEPYSAAFRRQLVELYRAEYGVSPERHWATVLVGEVEKARLQMQRDADAHRYQNVPTKSEATLRRRHPAPGEQKEIACPIVSEFRPTLPGRAVRRLFQIVDGARSLLRTEVLGYEFEYPVKPTEKVAHVLAVTRVLLSTLAIPQQLPSYADNPILVGWMLTRLGFDGGGGHGKVKRATLLAWLCDPDELARQIEQDGRRRVARNTGSDNDALNKNLLALAAKVRAAAKQQKLERGPH